MKSTFVILSVVGMLVVPGAAHARAGKNKKQARALYKAGKRHFQAKAYGAAVQAYKRSHALFPHRNTLYNIALSLAHRGEQKAAFRYLRRYLKRATPRDPPLDAILKKIRNRFGVLRVKVPDAKAGIYVDGRRVGRGKIRRILTAGSHALEIRQGNRVVARKLLELPGGRVVHWELGVLRVVAAHATDTIYVDGRRVGRGRFSQVVTSGRLVVELRRNDKVVARKELRVPANKTVVWRLVPKTGGVHTPAPRSPRTRLHWAWFTTFAAITVAAAVGATFTSLQTQQLWDEFKDDRTNRSLADRGDRMQLTANALWGATAALAAGTVLVAIFTRWGKPAERAGVTITPLLGPATAGATVTWRH